MLAYHDLKIDVAALEVWREDVRLPATPQGVRFLIHLASRPGEVVSRRELYQAFWPGDTDVDVDRALNTVVRQLRRALDDTPHAPRYIETLQGRGYRVVRPAPAAIAPVAATAPSPRSVRWRLVAAALAGLLLLVVAWWMRAPAPSGTAEREALLASVPAAARESFDFGLHLLQQADVTGRRRAHVPLAAALNAGPGSAVIRAYYAEALYWANELVPAQAEAERAYQEAPTLAHAQYVVGFLRHLVNWDWDGSARLLDSALASADPRPEYFVARAMVAATAGARTAAAGFLESAYARSPSESLLVADMGFVWLHLGNPARALHYCGLAVELAPTSTVAASCLFEGAMDADSSQVAAQAARLLAELTDDTTMATRLVGRSAEEVVDLWLAHAADLAAEASRGTPPCTYWCARLLARDGRTREALRALDLAMAEHSPLATAATTDPAFLALRSDSTFQRLALELVKHGAAPIAALSGARTVSHPVRQAISAR